MSNVSALTDAELTQARREAYEAWQVARDRAQDPHLSSAERRRARKQARTARQRLARRQAEEERRRMALVLTQDDIAFSYVGDD